MSNISSAQTEQLLSSHEFTEDTLVFYKALPEKESGWYFSDNNGVTFGPIHDEITARQMLAELSVWFDKKKAATHI